MEPLSYFLAFSRLAPVQCVTWGHPVTTGIPAIDYFLSHDALEQEINTAQTHYSEKLVPLRNLTCYQNRPTLTGPIKSRQDFGFNASDHLYVCSQSLFKIHPDFDKVLGEILRRDPDGKAVFLHGHYPVLAEDLLKRWRNKIPDVVDRIVFLKRLNQQDFIQLQALADVLLDTFYFAGGNTALEAFAFGTPTVTLPGQFLKGRVTYACYRQMGIMDCVANSPEEYVDIAVHLGTNHQACGQIRERILNASHILFNNLEYVREVEQFFIDAVERARMET